MTRQDKVKIALLFILSLAVIVRVLYLAEVHEDVLLRYVIKDDVYDQYRFMRSAAQLLNGGWLKLTAFYSLGYSFVISLLYFFLPKDISTVFVFQIILGVVAVYVSYRTVSLLFNNRTIGLIAALICSLYSPLVFQECDIERGAILAYSHLCCFYFLLRALNKDRLKYFFLAGLVLGFSIVIRPNILPIFVVPYIFFALKKDYKIRICRVSSFILGIMLLTVPFAFRNMLNGQGFSIEPQGIEAFWVGNTHDAPGIDLVWLDSQKQLAKESGNNIGKALSILAREIQKYPQDYEHLYLRKFKMFLNGFEVPANLNYYLFKERYLPLSICFFNFTIICPLALIGILLARRKFSYIGLLYIFLLVLSLSNIVFHIQGRYRIPAVPFFIIPAAYAIYWLFVTVRKKKWLDLCCVILVMAGIILYTKPDHKMIKKYSGAVITSEVYCKLAIAYLDKSSEIGIKDDQKDFLLKECFIYLEKAFKENPSSPLYYKTLAMAHCKQGRFEEAMTDLDRAIDLDPSLAENYYNRGLILAKQGHLTQAIADYSQAIAINPNYLDAYYNRGLSYAKEQEFDLAIADYGKDIALDPQDAQAYINLAIIYYQLGKYDNAWENVHRAQGLGVEVNPKIITALKQAS